MTTLEAHRQATALLALAALAHHGELLNARRAIAHRAVALLSSGLLSSSDRSRCEAALWACKEGA